MKSKRHSPEQVIKTLAEGDRLLNEGATVAEVARGGLPLPTADMGSIFWSRSNSTKTFDLFVRPLSY